MHHSAQACMHAGHLGAHKHLEPANWVTNTTSHQLVDIALHCSSNVQLTNCVGALVSKLGYGGSLELVTIWLPHLHLTSNL